MSQERAGGGSYRRNRAPRANGGVHGPYGKDEEPPAERRSRRAEEHEPPAGAGYATTDPVALPEIPGISEIFSSGRFEAPSTEAEESSSETEMIPRFDSVLEPCRVLLEEALVKLNSRAGVLYGVDGPRRIRVLSTVAMTDPAELPMTERAALSGLEAQRPLLAHKRSVHAAASCYGPGSEGPSQEEDLLVVPCMVQGDVPAVLVAARESTGTGAIDADLKRLGTTLPLALAADRARIHLTLARRMAEAEAIQRQLEAYAVDLRSVFMSERARSEELGRALVELEETYEATVRGLAIAVEAKDAYTGGHLFRVSRYGMTMTAIVAPQHRDDPQFEYGFLLHDVGKLAVPDAVLMKSGALTEEEWEQIREHPACGRNILDRIPFLEGASEIVYCHHERWDGKGFPRGLAGDEIPLGGRIFPIADAFDAMTTSRPYREAIAVQHAREELARCSGTQFWPEAVDAFMSIPIAELEEVRRDTHGASGW